MTTLTGNTTVDPEEIWKLSNLRIFVTVDRSQSSRQQFNSIQQQQKWELFSFAKMFQVGPK
jgi:hypothetical protein